MINFDYNYLLFERNLLFFLVIMVKKSYHYIVSTTTAQNMAVLRIAHSLVSCINTNGLWIVAFSTTQPLILSHAPRTTYYFLLLTILKFEYKISHLNPSYSFPSLPLSTYTSSYLSRSSVKILKIWIEHRNTQQVVQHISPCGITYVTYTYILSKIFIKSLQDTNSWNF